MKVGSKASVKNSTVIRTGPRHQCEAHHVDVGGAVGVAVARDSVKSSTTWMSPAPHQRGSAQAI